MDYFICHRRENNCGQMTSFAVLQPTLFYFLLVTSHPCLAKWLPMIPDGAQQVITAGSNLVLTCIYQYRDEYDTNFGDIFWKVPDYVERNPTGDLDIRLIKTFDRNETHSTSTLTLIKTRHTDTGYYGCVENGWNNKKIEQYVFIYNDKDVYYSPDGYQSSYLTFMDPYDAGYLAQQGSSLHIPCKPTHPNLSVSVTRNSEITAKGIVLTDKHDLLAEPDSNWQLKYDRGLTLKHTKVSDTGNYQCIGTMNNITDKKSFDVYVNGLELIRVGEDGDSVIEGSDVTLICKIFTANEFSSPPEWSYRINNTGPSQIINDLNPHEGIVIKTQQFSKEVCVGGCKEFIYYESQLDLLDVTLNSYTTYQCAANIDQQLVSKTISFLIKAKTHDKKLETTTIVVASITLTLILLLFLGIGISVKLYLDKKKLKREITRRINGYGINQDLQREYQIEFLPYDHKRWEFPRNRLTLGAEIGAGCFGRVVKAEAIGIKYSSTVNPTVQRRTCKTVAVKMVRTQTNDVAIDALISELKILIYLGSHLNVVNLLGACTKQITKGELLVIVEYCRFGNLQTYLINHRNKFINQLDEFGNIQCDGATDNMDRNLSYFADVERKHSQLGGANGNSCSNAYTQEDEDYIEEPETFWNYGEDPDGTRNPTISTRDLISWSFQVARGMAYLASRKVLHGDLAARNVLLADDGVVKVADFGMAKKMYYTESYEKKGKGPLPVKWMAIESLTDQTFSSQSDVWSYGILLWELFSLGKVPYPGRNAKFELIKVIQNGYRMEAPENAPRFFGEMMSNCWKIKPKERPTFSQLQKMIGDYLEPLAESDYLTMDIPHENFKEKVDEALQFDGAGHMSVKNEISPCQATEENVNLNSIETSEEITRL